MRGKEKYRIWPAYFNTRYSRGGGRRVPRDKAIRDPKPEDIVKAAERLGLNPLLEPGKAYSKYPWEASALILVDKKGTKAEIVKQLTEELQNA